MGLPKFFVLVLLFGHCVFAERFIKTTCDDKDGTEYITCVKDSLQEFFKLRSAGAPDKGIKSMDPALIEHIDVVEESVEMKSHFTNIKVTGFKDVKVVDYKEDEVKEDIEYKITLSLNFDFVAEGPVRIQMLKKDKSLTGDVKYEGGVNSVITYTSITKKVDNQEVYEFGPEQITCETQHAKSTLSEELRTAIGNDPDAQAGKDQYEKVKIEHQKKVVCEMAKAVLKTVVENLRILGRQPTLEQ